MRKYISNIKSKKSYHYFFLKLTLFAIFFFTIDVVGGKIFNLLYLRQKTGWEFRTKYAMEDTKADMLIFGSSRAQQQYNPVYFEERLKLSCYNVGRDGQVILYQYPLLQSVLKRYKPKMIMLECDNKMFIYNRSSYDRLSCLLPFYKEHPEIRPTLELRNINEKVKIFSCLYPYNSDFFKIMQGIFKKEDEDIKGYLPLKGALKETIRNVDLSIPYQVDRVAIDYFKLFIELCKLSNVKLVLTASPYFSKEYGEDISLLIAKRIAIEEAIPFYDLSKGHALLNRSNLFDDTAHVNQTGSKILSNIVLDSLIANKNL